jgi:hypothetical protein
VNTTLPTGTLIGLGWNLYSVSATLMENAPHHK